MDFHLLSSSEIRNRVTAGDLSAEEVVTAFMERALSLNSRLNAFIRFNEKAIEQARRIDKERPKGLLTGVPIAVKDMLCTKGLTTTAASKILENYVPSYSSTVVERLEQEGAIVIGKTNQDEFAMGSSNENSAYGIVRNPWNPEMVPGGSSGGSAVAVAARMSPGSIGTDTGGSIRQPANFCGVVGIKPTYGRVSRYGIIAFASSLDQAGPMASNVGDCALILQAISGHDPKDATSSHRPVPNWTANLIDDVRGMVIGRPREYFGEGLDTDVRKTMEHAFYVLKNKGAKIQDVSLPMLEHAISTYYLVATSEASSNLARYDGVRFGSRVDAKEIDQLYKKTRGRGFGAEVKRRVMLGTFGLSSGYYDAFYRKACQVRKLIQQDFLKAFMKCDVIVSPVTAAPAFPIGVRIENPLEMYLNDIYTTSTNLAGLPGMSVPGGWSSNGLPIGVQLTASHFNEEKIFNAALAIERHGGIEKRTPHVF